MGQIAENTALYNLLYALITGATASAFVSIVIELTNNYKNNKLAWYELQDYYSVVKDYELTKQVLMQQTLAQRAERKAIEEYIAAGGEYEEDVDDQPKDIVQATWKQLTKLMPVVLTTLENKKQFLTDDEISALQSIQFEYKQIHNMVYIRSLNLFNYDAQNHPDEDFMNGLYPQNILSDLPEWMKKHIASRESEAAIKRVTDVIMEDSFLLDYFMQEYNISMQGLTGYESTYSEGVEEETDSETDDLEQEEIENEVAFREEHERIVQEMEKRDIAFVSWHISKCCLNISELIDKLEKCILKKSYVGLELEFEQKTATGSLDDPIARLAYEEMRRHLEEK